MHHKKFVQLDGAGLCVNELEYFGQAAPVANQALLDVTARSDGPFLGKVYDAQADTFAWPEPVARLTVSQASIQRGGTATLTWETEHAVRAEIDQGVGELADVAGGEIEVSPNQTTTYQLTATGREGTAPATARRLVTVRQ